MYHKLIHVEKIFQFSQKIFLTRVYNIGIARARELENKKMGNGCVTFSSCNAV